MPLDIHFLRKNPKLVAESQKKREKKDNKSNKNVLQKVLNLDNEWIKAIQMLDDLNTESNKLQKKITDIYKIAVTYFYILFINFHRNLFCFFCPEHRKKCNQR